MAEGIEETRFFKLFFASHGSWPYAHTQGGLATAIRNNRASLDNVLFIDRLLADVAQITDGAKYYPPKNKDEFRRLYEKIMESEIDSLKKTCLCYYFLKDARTDIDGKYASEQAIPEQFCQLISGFYAMDHLQFEEAMQHFCYPNVSPGYTEVILAILLRHSEYPNAAQLAALFVEATKPALDTAEKMSLHMESLLRTDIDAAFKYQRTTPESIRRELFINLINVAMNERPPRQNLRRLLSFPLTSQEKDIFTDHLKSLEKQNGFAREILMMWDIQTAQYSAARDVMHGDGSANEKRRIIREGLEKAAISL